MNAQYLAPVGSISRIAIIEDNPALTRSLRRALEAPEVEVHSASTVADATALLQAWAPELLLLDYALPDGDALAVLAVVEQCRPQPQVIVMTGDASPEASFRLGEWGVRAYLRKPLDLIALEQTIARVLQEPPMIESRVRGLVGHVPVREVEETVRTTMVEEALSRSEGNRRGAARLLSISRQLLQHILRKPK